MRIRSVKPEYWSHRMHKRVSEPAALVALALLNYCDDQGRFLWDPDLFASTMFHHRPLSLPIRECMAQLVERGYVVVYPAQMDGETVLLGVVVSFNDHQVINKPKKSTLPACPRELLKPKNSWEKAPPIATLPEASGTETGRGTEDSSVREITLAGNVPDEYRGNGREWKGMEGSGCARAGDSVPEAEGGAGDLAGEQKAGVEPEPVIPSEAEVVSFGDCGRGIDPGFARNYYAKNCEKHAWVSRGRLIDWQRQLVRFWAEDRDGWLLKKKRGQTGAGSPAMSDEFTLRLDAINAELQWQSDPARLAELRKEKGTLWRHCPTGGNFRG